ncbi:unnamed protein product [Phytophthora lilii]|uniref:Unnamed protein product n=1 Tax=Phytophthora lilii TaxID=2077276 RepID=A0A9W6WZL3_9STRA|nr:unnamed protein product [Phytophthora lilii]
MPGKDPKLMRRTYAAILAFNQGEWFSEKTTMSIYDRDGPQTKYPIKFSVRQLKSVAGGNDSTAYLEWKAKHEPEPIKVDKIAKEKEGDVSDEDELRNNKLLALIANEVSMPADQLKTAIYDDSIEFSFEWCERYVKPMNRPVIGKWGILVKYIHCFNFRDDIVAAKLLALIVDLYFVCMVNGERYRRVDLTKDESNAEMVKGEPLMVQQQPYFHAYESFIVSFESLMDNADTSVFNSCVPFKAQLVEAADYSICGDILSFLYEIICNNNSKLYIQLLTALAKMVQYPDSKTEMLIILYSVLEGCGKTCFTDLLLVIFGIHSIDVSAGSIDSLVNERRSHLIGKKLCIVNEVREMKSSFGQHHEAFKSFLTDKYMSARPLYANKITFRNVLEAVITTNNLATIPSGKGARRFQLFELNDGRCQDKAYFGNLYNKSINRPEVNNAFYTYLMREVKVERGPMEHIVQTEAQDEFRQATEDNVSSFWRHVYNETPMATIFSKMDAFHTYTNWCSSHGDIPVMHAPIDGLWTRGGVEGGDNPTHVEVGPLMLRMCPPCASLLGAIAPAAAHRGDGDPVESLGRSFCWATNTWRSTKSWADGGAAARPGAASAGRSNSSMASSSSINDWLYEMQNTIVNEYNIDKCTENHNLKC